MILRLDGIFANIFRRRDGGGSHLSAGMGPAYQWGAGLDPHVRWGPGWDPHDRFWLVCPHVSWAGVGPACLVGGGVGPTCKVLVSGGMTPKH